MSNQQYCFIFSSKIINRVKEDKTTYVYGINIIEKELKEVPINIKFKGNMLREAVLTIYNSIIDEELKLFPIAKYLASDYFHKFDELRKSGKYQRLINPKIR